MFIKEQFGVRQWRPETCVSISPWPPIIGKHAHSSCGRPTGTTGSPRTPVGRERSCSHIFRGLFQLPDLPLAQRMQKGNYMAHCGAIWENMTYTEKYVASLFFKNHFKLHLKSRLSFTTVWKIAIYPQWHIRVAGQGPHSPHLGHGPSSHAC